MTEPVDVALRLANVDPGPRRVAHLHDGGAAATPGADNDGTESSGVDVVDSDEFAGQA